MSCRKQDGGQADIEECLKFSSPMPKLTQPCQNPCQEECQLTAWSKFSSCTADCVGVRTRKRLLVGESASYSSNLFSTLSIPPWKGVVCVVEVARKSWKTNHSLSLLSSKERCWSNLLVGMLRHVNEGLMDRMGWESLSRPNGPRAKAAANAAVEQHVI